MTFLSIPWCYPSTLQCSIQQYGWSHGINLSFCQRLEYSGSLLHVRLSKLHRMHPTIRNCLSRCWEAVIDWLVPRSGTPVNQYNVSLSMKLVHQFNRVEGNWNKSCQCQCISDICVYFDEIARHYWRQPSIVGGISQPLCKRWTCTGTVWKWLRSWGNLLWEACDSLTNDRLSLVSDGILYTVYMCDCLIGCHFWCYRTTSS